jgi:hypothetical protein
MVATMVGGCSTVGPGLANHPGDCAIGIQWADCLPGTRGYENGGGRVYREKTQLAKQQQQDAAKQQQDAAKQQQDEAKISAQRQCIVDMQTPALDAIRGKVELIKTDATVGPAFEIATNNSSPTKNEGVAIATWAKLRDGCAKRLAALSTLPEDAAMPLVMLDQTFRSIDKQVEADVDHLIVELYQQKLTYSEFAQKRYGIERDGNAAILKSLQATLLENQVRQAKAKQLDQERLNKQLHCTSNRYGDSVSTNCY